MEVEYLKSAFKNLEKLDRQVSKKIVYAIDLIPRGDIKKLKGFDNPELYRLRIGKYRVVFQKEHEKIIIIKIDTRNDIYKKINY